MMGMQKQADPSLGKMSMPHSNNLITQNANENMPNGVLDSLLCENHAKSDKNLP